MVSRQFLTAGRAVFTVANPAGERYTFKVKRKPPSGQYTRDAYFMYAKDGPKFRYLGLLDPATGKVRFTKGSTFTEDSIRVKVVRWILHLIYSSKPLPANYACTHEGHCARCGRSLTVPESIENGIGPECIKHVNGILTAEASEGKFDLGTLTPVYDNENEITHWTGFQRGQHILVFND